MNILYIDISLDGHREVYLRACEPGDTATCCWYLLPEAAADLRMTHVPMTSGFDRKRTPATYAALLREIRAAVKKYRIDIVHFLCGDALYRFFGVGLGFIGADIVVTYHHMVFTGLKTIAIRHLFRQSLCGIVHTDYLLTQLEAHGIRNGRCIHYPMLDRISDKTTDEAKACFGIADGPTVLGVVGATSRYKGLDILLDALNKVQYPCTLFVAGTPSAFGADDIADHLHNPMVRRNLHLRRLSDAEFADAVQASDLIVLPYRKEFDGASGPLVSAAVHGKPVIAADHGSLGEIVTRGRLGLCFESENPDRLADRLNDWLADPAKYTFDTGDFCRSLTVDAFRTACGEIYAMADRNAPWRNP